MLNKSKPKLTLVTNEQMFAKKELRMYSRLPMKSIVMLRQSKVKLRKQFKDMGYMANRSEIKFDYEEIGNEARKRKVVSMSGLDECGERKESKEEEGNKRLKKIQKERGKKEEERKCGLNRSCEGVIRFRKGKEEEKDLSITNEPNTNNTSCSLVNSVHNKNKNTNSLVQLYSIRPKTHTSLICDKFINIKTNSFSNNNSIHSNKNENSNIINNSKFTLLSIVNNSGFEIHHNNKNTPQPSPPNKSRNHCSSLNKPKKSQCKFDSFDSMYFSSSIHINKVSPEEQQPIPLSNNNNNPSIMPPHTNNNITITEREFISNPRSNRKQTAINPPFTANRPMLNPIKLSCANVSQDTIDVPLSSLRMTPPSFEGVLTDLYTNAVCIGNIFNQHKCSFTNEVLLLLKHLLNQNGSYILQLNQINQSKLVEYKLDFLMKNNNMCITLLKQVHVLTSLNLIQSILKENIDVINEIKHSNNQ